MIQNLGLVMTGGGARAAYQVGVVRALYEVLKNESSFFHYILSWALACLAVISNF
jgi:predicted patatin/cPLA2 family phospholipase